MGGDELPVLIVGDVHGDLERLFGALRPYPAERWHTVFLGDLINRGPFGVGALRYARDRPNSTVLLGNHEVLTLAALTGGHETYVNWAGVGGQRHDLDELRRDGALQGWVRHLPALARLADGTLVQHCDDDRLGQLVPHAVPDTVAAVNAEVTRLIEAGALDVLWDRMTGKRGFTRQPERLRAWLDRCHARRVVHGHTPHGHSEPVIYAGGRAINFDGGLGIHRPHRRPSPYRASVGPLPA